MKYNKIRPLLILAFIVGSFPLQSADFVPEQSFTALTSVEVSPCSSDDKGSDDDSDTGKEIRKIASTSCL